MTYYEKKHNRMVELIQAYDASRDESICSCQGWFQLTLNVLRRIMLIC